MRENVCLCKRKIHTIGFLVADSPLEREEHVFVFTCLNYFESARKLKSRILFQAQTFKRIKLLEKKLNLIPPFRGFPQAPGYAGGR